MFNRLSKTEEKMKKVFAIEDLDCAVCAAKIENAVKKLDGIEYVNVNFITQKMTIETNQNMQELMKKVVELVKKIEPDCTIIL